MNRKFKFSVIFLLVFLMVGTMLFGCVKKEEPQVSKETEAGNESKEPADKYPEHNIDIVIPSAEGGAIDRILGEL